MSRRRAVVALLGVVLCGSAFAGDLRVSVVDAAGHPLKDAVIYLQGGAPMAAPAPAPAVIDQVHKQFVPQVSVIQVGSAVSFPNNDQIRHSVYSFSEAKPFTLKLYAGKPPGPVVFDKPGVVVLGCNIHDQMAAWVVVVDTPYFGKTDANGDLSVQGVKPGTYELVAWYPMMEQGPTLQPVTLQSAEVQRRIQLPVTPLAGGG